MTYLVSSATALAFLINMSEKWKSTSPSAIQANSRWTTFHTEEKLDVISWLEKDKWIGDIWRNVKFFRSSIHTIHDSADTFTESAMSGPKVFV